MECILEKVDDYMAVVRTRIWVFNGTMLCMLCRIMPNRLKKRKEKSIENELLEAVIYRVVVRGSC